LRAGLGAAAILAAATLLPACRPGADPAGPEGRGGRPAERVADDVRRVFEENAARARNELEAARTAAEAVRSGAASGRDAAEAARARARRALLEGSRVLEEAARRGSHAAESWARLIQDRMMRLEESMRLLGADRGHADS
jgi:hypothetical protein